MSIRNKRKSAYPVMELRNRHGVLELEAEAGMELRDHFAAKVMQGLCASRKNDEWTHEWMANEAYQIADAMLIAREVKNGKA